MLWFLFRNGIFRLLEIGLGRVGIGLELGKVVVVIKIGEGGVRDGCELGSGRV